MSQNCDASSGGLHRRGNWSVSVSLNDLISVGDRFKSNTQREESELVELVSLLSVEVSLLKKRLTNLEKKFKVPTFLPFSQACQDQVEEEEWADDIEKTTTDNSMSHLSRHLSEAGKIALATVDHTLITSRPHNDSYTACIKNFLLVLRRNRFAISQCLFMVIALLCLLVFGIVRFVEAYGSVNAKWKPFKIEGKDDYHNNKNLIYEIPTHYFLFEMGVESSAFYDSYLAMFNWNCNLELKECLNEYVDFFIHPQSYEDVYTNYYENTYYNEDEYDGLNWYYYKPTIYYEPTIITGVGTDYLDTSVTGNCIATSEHNGTVEIKRVPIIERTFFLNDVGRYTENALDSNDTDEKFTILVKMKFETFTENFGGWHKCDIYLDMNAFNSAFLNFSRYDIHFMVSRTEYDSATGVFNDYIRSRKKVWRNTDTTVSKLYHYDYEESTFDGESEFTAELYVEDDAYNSSALLNIETYPYPTVVHYKSFDKYTYGDWIADVGGFYSLVISSFFVLSTMVVYFDNRNEAVHRRQGILPAFSMTYRNAEELSGLKCLVLAALGISQEAYFADDFQMFLKSSFYNLPGQ